jgi:hypothetical protein
MLRLLDQDYLQHRDRQTGYFRLQELPSNVHTFEKLVVFVIRIYRSDQGWKMISNTREETAECTFSRPEKIQYLGVDREGWIVDWCTEVPDS